jgi:hypothetical protein
MARSLGMSKLLVLVNLMLVNRANSPPKRCSHPFSDSFVKLSEKPHERAKRLTIKRLIAT